jgi:hypothetical protein
MAFARVRFLFFRDRLQTFQVPSLPLFHGLQSLRRSPQMAIPKCVWPVQNGEVLVPLRPPRSEGHILEIENGSGGNAIIKGRDALTGRLLFAFFVKASSTASFVNIPDGTYRFQYAIGGDLRADCMSFIQMSALGQFQQETLSTSFTATEIVRQEIGYTLHPVPHGNVTPQSLSVTAFETE